MKSAAASLIEKRFLLRRFARRGLLRRVGDMDRALAVGEDERKGAARREVGGAPHDRPARLFHDCETALEDALMRQRPQQSRRGGEPVEAPRQEPRFSVGKAPAVARDGA